MNLTSFYLPGLPRWGKLHWGKAGFPGGRTDAADFGFGPASSLTSFFDGSSRASQFLFYFITD